MPTADNSFTSVAEGRSILLQNHQDFYYSLSGVFSATMLLCKSVNGSISWEPILRLTSPASGVITIDNRADCPALIRWQCATYTSGTATTEIISQSYPYYEKQSSTGAKIQFIDNDGQAELWVNGTPTALPASIPPNANTIQIRDLIEGAGQYAQITFPAKKLFTVNGSIQPKIGQKINLNGSTIKRANAVKTATSAAIDPSGVAITSLTLTDASGLSVGGEISLYIDASPATVYSTHNYRVATKSGNTITLEDGILDTHFAGTAISSVYVVYSSHAIFDVTRGGNDLTSRCDHLSIINGWIDGNREYNNDGGAGFNANGTTENIYNNHASANLIGCDMNIAVKFKNAQADGLVIGGYRNRVSHSRFTECGGDGIHLTDTAVYAAATDDFGNVLEALCGAKKTRIASSKFRRCNLSNTRHNDGCIGLSNNVDDTVVQDCDMVDALAGVGGVGDRHNSNLKVKNCKIKKMGWRSTALDGFIADAGSGLTGSVIATSGAFGFYNGSTTDEGASNLVVEDCELVNNQPTFITGIATIGSALRPTGLRLINNRFRDSILTVTSFEGAVLALNSFKASGSGRSLLTIIDCPNLKSNGDKFQNGDIGLSIQTGTGGSSKGTVVNTPHFIGQQSDSFVISGSGTADVVVNDPVIREIPTQIQTLLDRFIQSDDAWFVSGGASIVQGYGGTAVSGSIVFTNGGVATQGYKGTTIGTDSTAPSTAGYDGARSNIGHTFTGTLVFNSGAGNVKVYSGNNLKQTLTGSGAINCTTDFSAHGALRIQADVGVYATVTDLSMTVTPAMTDTVGISITTSNATAASNTVSINNPDIEIQVASDTAYGINCTNANGNHKVNGGKLRTTRAGIKATPKIKVKGTEVEMSADVAGAIGVSLTAANSAVYDSTVRCTAGVANSVSITAAAAYFGSNNRLHKAAAGTAATDAPTAPFVDAAV